MFKCVFKNILAFFSLCLGSKHITLLNVLLKTSGGKLSLIDVQYFYLTCSRAFLPVLLREFLRY